MNPSSPRIPLSALFLAVAALAGCGGGDSDPPPAPPPPPAPTAQTISFTSPGNQTLGTAAPALSATATSGLTVSFASTTAAVCTVTGTDLTLVSAGDCSITASQAGNATFSAAPAVSVTFTVAPAPVPTTTIVNFEESTAPTLAGFGGAEDSTVVADPTNASNKVGKVVKSATAELWAGTTVSICPSNSIVALPFSATNTKMSARVWSPDAGIPVRLKVENATDGTKSVETEATVTTAAGWQTLTFDFATQAAGTAALNVANTYNKASIFFNFGTTGATAGSAKTYYFDDLKFVGSSFTVACPAVAPALTFSNGYTSLQGPANQGTTAQGGIWGYFSGNFSSYANTYTGGGFMDAATPPATADAASFYIAVTTSAPTTDGYIGMYVTHGTGLQLSGQTDLEIELGIDANHVQQASNKDITVTIEGKTTAYGDCKPQVNRKVTPSTDALTAYTLPLNSFAMAQNCGDESLTVAGILGLPINAVNSQLNFPNVNTTVVNGGFYGTGISRGKTMFK